MARKKKKTGSGTKNKAKKSSRCGCCLRPHKDIAHYTAELHGAKKLQTPTSVVFETWWKDSVYTPPPASLAKISLPPLCKVLPQRQQRDLRSLSARIELMQWFSGKGDLKLAVSFVDLHLSRLQAFSSQDDPKPKINILNTDLRDLHLQLEQSDRMSELARQAASEALAAYPTDLGQVGRQVWAALLDHAAASDRYLPWTMAKHAAELAAGMIDGMHNKARIRAATRDAARQIPALLTVRRALNLARSVAAEHGRAAIMQSISQWIGNVAQVAMSGQMTIGLRMETIEVIQRSAMWLMISDLIPYADPFTPFFAALQMGIMPIFMCNGDILIALPNL